MALARLLLCRERMSASRAVAILALVGSAACDHRAVGGFDLGPAGFAHDGPIVLPDRGVRRLDGGTPEVCLREPLVQLASDPQGLLTLALPPSTAVLPVALAGAKPGETAVALDLAPVAALAALRPGALTPSLELAAILKRLSALLAAGKLGGLSVRASGTPGKSASGQPDVKEAIWDLEAASAGLEPAAIRALLLAAVLDRQPGSLSLSTAPVSAPSPQLTLKLTVAKLGSAVATSAAVVTRGELDGSDRAAFALDDLANGTALAGPKVALRAECDSGIVDGSAMADILWVIDESGSMSDNRKDIVSHANSFFSRARAAGLDLRMGVTGVKKPTPDSVPGKLCSRAPRSEVADDGGEDRFLTADEQALFSACVENPPYYEGGEEYGLTAIYWAIKRHLPRAKGAVPGKIREGAKLAIVVATDEAPEELKQGGSFEGRAGFLKPAELTSTSCSLTAAHQASLDEMLRPLRELFAQPAAQATLHVIGGICNNACNAELAVGYRELAAELGGQVGDVCQHNLNATIDVVIDSIAAAASPRVLAHVPVSSTLAVEGNGLALPRSRNKGYLYNAATNSLTFVNVKLVKGDEVVASYRRFAF